MLATDLGRAVIANSATQILLRQAPQAISLVAAEFRLSAGSRRCCCPRGGARAFLAGLSVWVSFQALVLPA